MAGEIPEFTASDESHVGGSNLEQDFESFYLSQFGPEGTSLRWVDPSRLLIVMATQSRSEERDYGFIDRTYYSPKPNGAGFEIAARATFGPYSEGMFLSSITKNGEGPDQRVDLRFESPDHPRLSKRDRAAILKIREGQLNIRIDYDWWGDITAILAVDKADDYEYPKASSCIIDEDLPYELNINDIYVDKQIAAKFNDLNGKPAFYVIYTPPIAGEKGIEPSIDNVRRVFASQDLLKILIKQILDQTCGYMLIYKDYLESKRSYRKISEK